MNLNQIIIDLSKSSIESLQKVADYGAKQIKTFEIDCNLLEDYNNVDIRNSEKFKELFSDIKTITGPALYYFEITSHHSSNDVVENIYKYSKLEKSKKTPAVKKKIPASMCLYVGKTKKHMWGRLIQHFGFYRVNSTQGLQLYYWAKDISLKLRLTVIEFEPAMSNLLVILENDLAYKLNPILGKHKI